VLDADWRFPEPVMAAGFTPSRCRVEALARDRRDLAAMVATAGTGDPHR
jgi:hypothetical protein